MLEARQTGQSVDLLDLVVRQVETTQLGQEEERPLRHAADPVVREIESGDVGGGLEASRDRPHVADVGVAEDGRVERGRGGGEGRLEVGRAETDVAGERQAAEAAQRAEDGVAEVADVAVGQVDVARYSLVPPDGHLEHVRPDRLEVVACRRTCTHTHTTHV